MESFIKERDHQKNAPFVKHHMDKYEGHFPIWVAIELFTFENLSSLYSIMVLEDRKKIAQLYNTEPKYLGRAFTESGLYMLMTVRRGVIYKKEEDMEY